jgi:hypothetical protein
MHGLGHDFADHDYRGGAADLDANASYRENFQRARSSAFARHRDKMHQVSRPLVSDPRREHPAHRAGGIWRGQTKGGP